MMTSATITLSKAHATRVRQHLLAAPWHTAHGRGVTGKPWSVRRLGARP